MPCQNNPLSQHEKDFIYEFSVWIYRTIEVYNNTTRNGIVYHQKIACLGKSTRQINNTCLDILLALIDFNKHNQDFIFFILKNIHSGYNRIHWSKTISTTRAIVCKNSPVYTNPVNRKKQINFDEELLIIFFSILNYISERYGFTNHINCNFQLITGYRFNTYLDGLGKIRLLQIKYKYFSDKALYLWQLCYDFFNNAKRMNIQKERKEYLLVKSFNIVFEAIIDELRQDIEKVNSLLAGTFRLNLHEIYGEFGGKQIDRNEVTIDQFTGWMQWAKEQNMKLDFNSTSFSHPAVC